MKHRQSHSFLAPIRVIPRFLVGFLASLPAAFGAQFEEGHLFIANLDDDVVVEIDGDGDFVRTIGEGAGLVDPRGIAFGPDGLLYVTSGDQILAFDADGVLDRSIGSGTPLSGPRGLAFGPRGRLYATSTDRVLVFDGDDLVVQTIGDGDSLLVPIGLAFGPEGNLYIGSAGNNAVFVFDPSGQKIGEIGAGSTLNVPMAIAIDPSGRLLVASLFSSSYLGFDADANEVLTASNGALVLPSGVALGPDGNTYVTSTVTGSIAVFDADGVFIDTVDAGGEVDATEGIAFAPAREKVKISGTLFSSESGQQKISEKATLVWAPGTREIRLQLKSGDLASSIGTTSITFVGFVEDANASGKKRALHGVAQLREGHAASLDFRISGKLVTQSLGDAFSMKSGSGHFAISSDSLVFTGSLKSSK